MLETKPMQKLILKNNLVSFKHKGYWQCVDNRRDLNSIRNLIKNSGAPWIKKI